MMARWDVLLVAAVLSGGSMMIENSHRVDTGVADNSAASGLPACAQPAADGAEPAGVSSGNARDTHLIVSAADDDAALTSCD